MCSVGREWEWERVRMREETFFINFPWKVFMSVEEGFFGGICRGHGSLGISIWWVWEWVDLMQGIDGFV